jgi:hypothetical protein
MTYDFTKPDDATSKFYALREYLEHYTTTKNRDAIFAGYKITKIHNGPSFEFEIQKRRHIYPDYNILTFIYNPFKESTKIVENNKTKKDVEKSERLIKLLENSIFKEFFIDSLSELEKKIKSEHQRC